MGEPALLASGLTVLTQGPRPCSSGPGLSRGAWKLDGTEKQALFNVTQQRAS